MFLIRFADFHHGGQALQIAGISPWILTVSEIGQRTFFHDFFHEGILCDIMLLEKGEELLVIGYSLLGQRMKKRLLLGRDLCPKGPFEEETKPRMNANRREWGKSYWL
jgi:hypothetical protein